MTLKSMCGKQRSFGLAKGYVSTAKADEGGVLSIHTDGRNGKRYIEELQRLYFVSGGVKRYSTAYVRRWTYWLVCDDSSIFDCATKNCPYLKDSCCYLEEMGVRL